MSPSDSQVTRTSCCTMSGLEQAEQTPSNDDGPANDNECSICLEEIEATELVELSCHHKFHKACIVTQMTFGKNKRVCALCRIPLPTLSDLVPNFEEDYAHCMVRPKEDPISNYGTIQGGATALHLACSQGHDSIVKILLDHGANIHAQVNDGKSVLHIAALSRRDSTINLLIDRGANVEMRDKLGFTPVMVSALKGFDSTTTLFLDRGALINVQDPLGNSAGSLASRFGHESTRDLIIQRGGVVTVSNPPPTEASETVSPPVPPEPTAAAEN
mmetsp:Transcript_32237/g.41432  ORF Transcript_32237/g.41432 Transcript_32237/m.41432 type:complete len:273 (+) Transcript_32237:12-830(+)